VQLAGRRLGNAEERVGAYNACGQVGIKVAVAYVQGHACLCSGSAMQRSGWGNAGGQTGIRVADRNPTDLLVACVGRRDVQLGGIAASDAAGRLV
jgi:hypothetical protein